MMPDTHLLVPADHGWQVHCGASTLEAVVPLSLQHRVTCPRCLQWPHPAARARQRSRPGPQQQRDGMLPPLAARTMEGETVLSTGLAPLMGGRGKPMNQTEYAYYTVLNNDPTVLKVFFEPWGLPLGKKMVFWIDFVVIKYDGSIEFHEIKGGKKGKSGAILARWQGDGRSKWLMFCEKYGQQWKCVVVAGMKEKGIFQWGKTIESDSGAKSI